MKKAAHYQSLEYDRIASMMQEFQSERPALRILDFGCGLGKFLEATLSSTWLPMNLLPSFHGSARC